MNPKALIALLARFAVLLGIAMELASAATPPPFRWVTSVSSDYNLDDIAIAPAGHGFAVFTHPESESSQIILGDHSASGTWFLARFDKNGTWEWVQSLGSDSNQHSKVVLDRDGNCIVTCSKYIGQYVDVRVSIAKYSALGARIWATDYGFPNANAWISGIATDMTGNIFLAGGSYPGFSQGFQATLISFAATGSFRWFQQFGDPLTTERNWHAIAARSDGELIVCGYVGSRYGNNKLTVARYGSDGQQRQEWVASNAISAEGAKVIFDAPNAWWVTGTATRPVQIGSTSLPSGTFVARGNESGYLDAFLAFETATYIDGFRKDAAQTRSCNSFSVN